MKFDDYLAHGWRLCVIPPRAATPDGRVLTTGKGPIDKGWNAPGRPQQPIPPGCGAGLMHVESGTCAIDIDEFVTAQIFLAQRGVDLDSLLTAPAAVRINSGREGRAKLLYRLSEPLRSIKTAPFEKLSPRTGKNETYTALDFRCATRDGLSLQDVLPPTVHPDTGRPYEWQYADPIFGSWRNLPPLPPELRAVWESLLVHQTETSDAVTAPKGAGFDEIRALLAQQDPNAAYNEWLRVGMAIHHETRGSREGLLLWNEWSAQAKGSDKYKGLGDLEPHWRSFNANAPDAVTLGSLRAEAVAEVADFEKVPVSTKPAVESRFRIDDGDDLESAPPMEWIVDKVLPQAATGVVFGPSGAGKTAWLVDLVLHIAAGLPWRDMPVKQRRVFYIAGEGAGGFRGVEGRYGRARRKLGLERPPIHFITNTSPNLYDKADPPEIARLMKEARDTPAGLVVFDTLAQMTPGADENSAKDMTIAMKNCRFIHEATGAMVLLIAHAGKDIERGIRGSTAIKGDVDVAIEVTEQGGGIHVARIDKMRDGEGGAQYPFRLERGLIEHTDERPQSKVTHYRRDSIEAKIREVFPDLSPLGSGIGVPQLKLINALIDRTLFTEGTSGADKEAKVTRALERYLNDPTSGLIVHKGLIYPRDGGPAFENRPVEGGGRIDAEPTPVQDHSDLLG